MNSVVHVVFHTELSIPHYLASSFGKILTLLGYRLSDLPLFWRTSLLTGPSCQVTAANEDLDRGCSGERLRQGSKDLFAYQRNVRVNAWGHRWNIFSFNFIRNRSSSSFIKKEHHSQFQSPAPPTPTQSRLYKMKVPCPWERLDPGALRHWLGVTEHSLVARQSLSLKHDIMFCGFRYMELFSAALPVFFFFVSLWSIHAAFSSRTLLYSRRWMSLLLKLWLD